LGLVQICQSTVRASALRKLRREKKESLRVKSSRPDHLSFTENINLLICVSLFYE